ncbi:MAG TPA: hypothetical protein VGQ02_10305 [Candidatus Limnocylindrales bacterium]|nr:hypothetical protein [Candidatus Limnocylindrales bacterium]
MGISNLLLPVHEDLYDVGFMAARHLPWYAAEDSAQSNIVDPVEPVPHGPRLDLGDSMDFASEAPGVFARRRRCRRGLPHLRSGRGREVDRDHLAVLEDEVVVDMVAQSKPVKYHERCEHRFPRCSLPSVGDDDLVVELDRERGVNVDTSSHAMPQSAIPPSFGHDARRNLDDPAARLVEAQPLGQATPKELTRE